jgi:hypothetical protein
VGQHLPEIIAGTSQLLPLIAVHWRWMRPGEEQNEESKKTSRRCATDQLPESDPWSIYAILHNDALLHPQTSPSSPIDGVDGTMLCTTAARDITCKSRLVYGYLYLRRWVFLPPRSQRVRAQPVYHLSFIDLDRAGASRAPV